MSDKNMAVELDWYDTLVLYALATWATYKFCAWLWPGGM